MITECGFDGSPRTEKTPRLVQQVWLKSLHTGHRISRTLKFMAALQVPALEPEMSAECAWSSLVNALILEDHREAAQNMETSQA